MNKVIPVIRVKNFSFYSDNQKIFEDVSMDIQENKVIAITGHGSCGKSSFLKSLNRISELEGVVRVDGKVEFLGQNIYERRINLNRLRRQVSMVFSQPNLFPMSIYDNVAYGVKLVGWRPKLELDDIVESAIKAAGLWDEVKTKIHKSALELSNGQQQRLCIARVLAVKPKVIMMDEPFLGFDTTTIIKIEELIHCLRSEFTIIIATNNLQQVTRLSDFTAFFETNDHRVSRMLEFAPTTKLFTNALDSRHRDYILARFS